MKAKKDQRVRKNLISLKEFLIIFVLVLFTCGNYQLINLQYWHGNPTKASELSVVTIALLLVVSLFGALLIGLFKKVYFDKPIRTISKAAEKVANGDFSVEIPASRKDNKKDELELLIENFNKMVKELNTIETLKTDFISNVSHELKTPLSIIQNYAMAIQGKNVSVAEQAEYAQTIVSASKRLTELVSNILKLNKLENQEIFSSPEPYALDEQLRSCLLNYENELDKKKIIFQGEDMAELTVNYDESLLELVWNNLISNAVKFTDVGGTITISLKKAGNLAIVTIKNTGRGMDEDTIAHIFERFYQGDSSHSAEGNGLGLALVKRVMLLVKGEIEVESQLNGETSFTVKLKI